MKIILDIQRYSPEKEPSQWRQQYEVETAPTDRVLDALMKIKREQDGTLVFRKSCAHGVCGSDGMMINGDERLACKTLVQEVAPEEGAVITIEPLRTFAVERDLLVDQSVFFRKYQSVKPYLINAEEVKEKERLQSPHDRKQIDDATACILCCICFSACPVLQQGTDFLGPAIIAQASRFLDDTRDKGFKDRLAVLKAPEGVWPCENHFECTRTCPRGVKVTKRINETKRRIEAFQEKQKKSENE